MNATEAIDRIFAVYDTDNSGTLNKNKLANIFEAFSQAKGNSRLVSQEEIDRALRYIGKDDGTLSKTEFLRFVERLVSQK